MKVGQTVTTIIKNCVITHQDSEIIKSYDVRANSKEYHTGVDIKAENVYCPCYGMCIYVGLVDNSLSCTIQYSANICLRYTHLKEVVVSQGAKIKYDDQIGVADRYVHFEYLTSEQCYPNFRVFFQTYNNSYYMYKHDPMLVLSGNTVFDNSPRLDYTEGLFSALYEDGLGPDETLGVHTV